MKERCPLKNENGSVLIVALIILVLLTLIGISATTTSEIETKIAGNERVFKRNLYLAEAGAMHGAQDLEDIGNPKTNPPAYLHPTTVDYTDIRDDAWFSANSLNSTADTDGNTRLLASSLGIAGGKKGSSLDVDVSKVHAYNIYGRWHNAAIPSKGRVIVEVGYRKAF